MWRHCDIIIVTNAHNHNDEQKLLVFIVSHYNFRVIIRLRNFAVQVAVIESWNVCTSSPNEAWKWRGCDSFSTSHVHSNVDNKSCICVTVLTHFGYIWVTARLRVAILWSIHGFIFICKYMKLADVLRQRSNIVIYLFFCFYKSNETFRKCPACLLNLFSECKIRMVRMRLLERGKKTVTENVSNQSQ